MPAPSHMQPAASESDFEFSRKTTAKNLSMSLNSRDQFHDEESSDDERASDGETSPVIMQTTQDENFGVKLIRKGLNKGDTI